MQPHLRYLVYTLAVAVCTAYLVQMETVEPGSLKLLVYTGDEDTLGTSEYSPIENLQVLLLAACAGPFTALFLVTFAENKVTGLALIKILNTVNMLPVLAYFVPEPWQWAAA